MTLIIPEMFFLTKRITMKRFFLLFSFILLPISCLLGQDMGPPPGPRPMNREVRRQLEQIKIWQMTQDMNLPTDKAEKFFPLYNNYNSQLRDINSERIDAIKSLDSLLKDNSETPEIKKKIEQVLNIDAQLAEQHRKFIQALGEILSPIEVAKYIVFEQKFDREIRQRIRAIMQQRMRTGGRY
jgi:Spy/CpxP family protein refolding chaperone